MAKNKKEVSTKKTAGKSAVKSTKKATPKKAPVKKKAKATADKARSVKATDKARSAKAKLAKSKKASAVKKTTKGTKGNSPAIKLRPTKAKPAVKKTTAKKVTPAKKTVATKKKAIVKKSASIKKTAVSAKKAPAKKTVAKKKTVAPKKAAVVKKATTLKKAVAAKKTTVAKKAAVVKKPASGSVKTTANKPVKTAASNTITKTSFVKNFALTSTADLTSEKEKESTKATSLETPSENGGTITQEAVKTHVKVIEPKKKEIKHTITDPSVDPIKHLADIAVEGILEVKGRNISVLNLKNIHNRVCDYFIICQADSNTQVNAIAGSVEEMVKKITGERPYRKEGFENAEWILVDYVTVVVHIFQSQIRNFYNLESLWADAEITELAFD
jgi:ribosome-associated protein